MAELGKLVNDPEAMKRFGSTMVMWNMKSRYTTGRVTLLSFIYTDCVDPIGCPLAFEVFRRANGSGIFRRLP
ncbi:MAG: hypothetical protein JWM42_333 [Burkholderia sp.]|nr:hypothetical protein [Burkholderia sp.]